MNSKLLIVGGLSFAAGFVSGYFVPRWLDKRRIVDGAEAVEHPFAQSDRLVKETPANDSKAVSEAPEGISRARKVIDRDEMSQYRDYASMYHKDEEKETQNYVTGKALSEEKPESDKPYIITGDDYYDTNRHYDKLTVMYYTYEQMCCDENEALIDDPEAILGENVFNKFGMESGDPEIVYIRNEKTHADYEVIRKHMSYRVAVLGEEPEE